MSLDTEKIHRLKGKEFDELYKKGSKKWSAMVQMAHDYAQSIMPKGEHARIGDVVEIVQNAIKIDPDFEKHFSEQKLTQKYWAEWYAEYIVEQVYPHGLS